MANAFIIEYSEMATEPSGETVPVGGKILETQTVVYTTSVASLVFNARTRFVRIISDAKAHIVFAVGNPIATVTDPFVPSNTPEYFGVAKSSRIAFYDGTS